MTTFNTPKGTTLPLLSLKNKPYLQVAHRIVWFREERPHWSIETEVKVGDKGCLAKAIIKNDLGVIMATAHKTETPIGFPDYVEKSETGAIGRALALCGYGTQFAPEFDEEDRIVDAPTQRQIVQPGAKVTAAKVSAPERSASPKVVFPASASKQAIINEIAANPSPLILNAQHSQINKLCEEIGMSPDNQRLLTLDMFKTPLIRQLTQGQADRLIDHLKGLVPGQSKFSEYAATMKDSEIPF